MYAVYLVCVSMSQTITLLPHSCHRTGVMDRAITVLPQMWRVLESSPLTMIHNDCNPHNICPRRAPIPTVTMEGALPIPAVHTTSPSLAAPYKVQTQNSVEKGDEHFNSPKRSKVKKVFSLVNNKALRLNFMLLTVEYQPYCLKHPKTIS